MNAWRPQLQKLQIYEGIFNLNRAFQETLLSLERLENLGFFRSEYLNAFKVELEHTRANANDELIETLRDYEQNDGYRFWKMQKQWNDQLKDADDVFLEAKKRKEEIKEKMKDLQRGFNRLRPEKEKTTKANSVRKGRSAQR